MTRHTQRTGSALTELEGAVLGHLSQQAPCSAYRVRMCFAASPSAVWSGSAGAIYPLLQRLEQRGLVRSMAMRQGRRPGRNYTLTAAGRGALRAWIEDARAAADPGFDPLRTRALSLSTLPPARRRRFLAAARRELQLQLAATRARSSSVRQSADEAQADRGLVLQIQAKLRWLAQLDAAADGR